MFVLSTWRAFIAFNSALTIATSTLDLSETTSSWEVVICRDSGLIEFPSGKQGMRPAEQQVPIIYCHVSNSSLRQSKNDAVRGLVGVIACHVRKKLLFRYKFCHVDIYSWWCSLNPLPLPLKILENDVVWKPDHK